MARAGRSSMVPSPPTTRWACIMPGAEPIRMPINAIAMLGKQLRYQNGFDCQGLWVEVEVEKEKKLGSKRDIENLVPGDKFESIDLFVHRVQTACR